MGRTLSPRQSASRTRLASLAPHDFPCRRTAAPSRSSVCICENKDFQRTPPRCHPRPPLITPTATPRTSPTTRFPRNSPAVLSQTFLSVACPVTVRMPRGTRPARLRPWHAPGSLTGRSALLSCSLLRRKAGRASVRVDSGGREGADAYAHVPGRATVLLGHGQAAGARRSER